MTKFSRPKALLFDIGGVCVVSPFQGVLDYERAHQIPIGYVNYATSKAGPNGAWQRAERGEMQLDEDFFKAYKANLEDKAIWERFLAAKKLQSAPVPTIKAQDLFWKMMGISRAPDPYMYPALRRLQASGKFYLAALSNVFKWPDGHPYNERTADDVRNFFDVFVSSAEVGMRKPEPRVYQEALRQIREKSGILDLRPEDVVFFDDIGENLKAARGQGLRTVKVGLGKTRDAVLELERLTGLELLEDRPRL